MGIYGKIKPLPKKGVKHMREENKKEKLTREKIISDIKNYYFLYAKGSIAFVIITIVFIGVFVLLDVSSQGRVSMKTFWLFLVLLSVVVSSFGIYLYHINILKKGSFRIETDYVADKTKTNTYSNIFVRFRSIFEQTYKIIFTNGKKYTLTDNIEYYKWTGWGLRQSEVYNSTEIGDEFYIVVTNKNRILQIYNKKLFELKD